MPSTVTFTIQCTVSEQFISDVMTTALEGGYMSWAYIEDVTRATGHPNGLDNLSVTSFRVSDRENEDHVGECDEPLPAECCEPEFAPRLKVNGRTVALGIQRLLNGDVKITDDLMDQVMRSVREADFDIDAIASDCVIQAGLFGRIIFG